MPRHPKRLLIPILALLALVFLLPTLATAQPHHGEAVPVAAERPAAGPSFFSKIRSLLSVLWAETGSGLDPNGTGTGPSSGSGTNAAGTGDNGSGLEPNG